MKILVIIPCYNEAENIAKVVRRLRETCPAADYVVVNDCSTDKSVQVLKAEGCNYLDLPVNLGIGGGVQCGYRYAVEHGYDVTVQMDGDGQHDPAYLQAVIAPVLAGHLDMCIGSRFITKEGFQTSFMRRVGIRFLSSLLHVLTGCKVLDVTSGYRACGKALTARFAQCYAQDYPEPEAILRAVCEGYKVGEVPVVMAERQGGKSSINALKIVYYMVKVSLSLVIYRLCFTKKDKRRNEA